MKNRPASPNGRRRGRAGRLHREAGGRAGAGAGGRRVAAISPCRLHARRRSACRGRRARSSRAAASRRSSSVCPIRRRCAGSGSPRSSGAISSTRRRRCRPGPRRWCSCSRATRRAPKRRPSTTRTRGGRRWPTGTGSSSSTATGCRTRPNAREKPAMPKGGFLQGCLAEHAGEGIDVAYVRRILAQLGTELRDRSNAHLRDRAVGGRGHGVRARAGSAGSGRGHRARRGAAVSTDAGPGCTVAIRGRATNACRSRCSRPRTIRSSRTRRAARANTRPRATRAWKRRETPGWPRSGSRAPPRIDVFPDVVQGDSYQPQTGRASSTIERQRYGRGPTVASSGTTRRTGWGTGGRTRPRRGAACGRGSARPTRTSTSPMRPGRSSSVTRLAHRSRRCGRLRACAAGNLLGPLTPRPCRCGRFASRRYRRSSG